MRHLLFLLVLLAAPAFGADLVMKNKANGSELRLYDSPCVNAETLMQLAEEWRPKFRAAKILDGKGRVVWFGCWIRHDDDALFVIFQDGDERMFELAAFSDPAV